MLNSGKFPRDIEHLAGLNIMVGEDTSYSQTIKSLQLDGYDINASFTSEYSTEELLENVASNEIDCTIADSNIYALNLRYFTEMRLAFTISEREQLAWVLAPDSKELEADMYAWLNTFNQVEVWHSLKITTIVMSSFLITTIQKCFIKESSQDYQSINKTL